MDEGKTRKNIETDTVRIKAAGGTSIAGRRRVDLPFDFVYVNDAYYDANNVLQHRWIKVAIAYHNPGTHLTMIFNQLSDSQKAAIADAMKIRDRERYGTDDNTHAMLFSEPIETEVEGEDDQE